MRRLSYIIPIVLVLLSCRDNSLTFSKQSAEDWNRQTLELVYSGCDSLRNLTQIWATSLAGNKILEIRQKLLKHLVCSQIITSANPKVNLLEYYTENDFIYTCYYWNDSIAVNQYNHSAGKEYFRRFDYQGDPMHFDLIERITQKLFFLPDNTSECYYSDALHISWDCYSTTKFGKDSILEVHCNWVSIQIPKRHPYYHGSLSPKEP